MDATSNLLKQLAGTKKSCVHSLAQMYSTLYYEARIAPAVDAAFLALGHKPSAAEHLSIITRLTSDAWANEDEETIAAVQAAVDDEKVAKLTNLDDENSVERTPAQYQKYVSSALLSEKRWILMQTPQIYQ